MTGMMCQEDIDFCTCSLIPMNYLKKDCTVYCLKSLFLVMHNYLFATVERLFN